MKLAAASASSLLSSLFSPSEIHNFTLITLQAFDTQSISSVSDDTSMISLSIYDLPVPTVKHF